MSARRERFPIPVAAAIVHDAALLAAVFYAPIYWGGFSSAGQSFAACLVGIALVAALVARFAHGQRLSLIPNAIHLPTAAFLGVSALSAVVSVSAHDSSLELSRLTIGALLFALVANRAGMPASAPKAVAALFAVFALAVPFIHVPGEAGTALDLLTIVSAALVCALIVMTREPNDTPQWLWMAAVVVGGLVVAPTGLREKVIAYFVLRNPTWPIFATFFNPNPLGGFLAMTAPLAASAALSSALRWQKALWGLAVLLLLLALLPTYSKGAAVGLLVATAVYLVLTARASANPRRNLRMVVLAFGITIVLAASAVTASSSLRNRLSGMLGSRSVSNMFRILTWKGTLDMAADYPWLGIGPGAFQHAFPKYAIAGYVEAAHENYLQILAEQGVFGAGAFLWLVGAVLFTGRRALARAPDAAGRAVAIGALCGIIALLVHSLFDYDWYIGAINLWFWLFAGLLAHQAHGRPVEAVAEEPSERRRGRRRGRSGAPARQATRRGRTSIRDAVIGLGLAGVLVIASVVSVRNALATRALDAGDAAVARAQAAKEQHDDAGLDRERDNAFGAFAAAAHYDPGWATALERYGLMLAGREGLAALELAATLEPAVSAPNGSAQSELRAGDSAVARALDALRRGDVPEMKREREAALRHYQDAAQKNPDWQEAEVRHRLLQSAVREEGANALKRAADREPTDFQWRAALARYYETNGELREAIAYYQQALDRFPNSTRILRQMAETCQKLGDTAGALRLYRRMVEIEHSPSQQYRALADVVDTEYAYAHYHLGRLAEKSGRLQEATHEFQETLRVIGDYQFRGKKTDEMLVAVGRPREPRAEELTVLEAMARWRMADVYQRLGEAKTAEVHRQKALSLLPGAAKAVAGEDAGEGR